VTDAEFTRRTVAAGAIAALLGVLIGAFGSHGLDDWLARRGVPSERIAQRIEQFEIGARYHLVHAVGLLAVAPLGCGSLRGRRAVVWLLVAGLLLFSGSLYLLVLTDTTWLGAITPIGGVSWIVAWAVLAVLAVRSRTRR